MPHRSRIMLAALTSALLLSIAVASAQANRFATNSNSFRIVFTPMSFVSIRSARCDVTLEGSLHSRTIAKIANSLIGYITSVSIANCNPANSVRANTETLPYHLTYNSFAGTLPNITSISLNMIRWSFEVTGEIFGVRFTCKYTPASELLILRRETTRGNITSGQPGTEETSSETGGCPSLRLEGTGNMTVPGGAFITYFLV